VFRGGAGIEKTKMHDDDLVPNVVLTHRIGVAALLTFP
jgi:hypothetical protein